MSALPPKATLNAPYENVRYGPKADIRKAKCQVRVTAQSVYRCAGNSKIKIALLVYGYSNLTWASPYGVLRAK